MPPNIVRYRGHQQYATTAELYMVLGRLCFSKTSLTPQSQELSEF